MNPEAGSARKIGSHSWSELHLHTLRKFYQTHCKLNGCRTGFIDFWMGHHPAKQDTYLNDSYFRPEMNSHTAEYRKAVESLTIFETGNLANVRARELNDIIDVQREEIEKLRKKVEKYHNELGKLSWTVKALKERARRT